MRLIWLLPFGSPNAYGRFVHSYMTVRRNLLVSAFYRLFRHLSCGNEDILHAIYSEGKMQDYGLILSIWFVRSFGHDGKIQRETDDRHRGRTK